MTHKNLARTTRRRTRASDRLKQVLVAAMIASTTGCGILDKVKPGPHDNTPSYHDSYGMQIEYPEVCECSTPVSEAARQTTEPMALEDPSQMPSLDLTLEEAVQLAVQQSPVLRSIGGTIVSSPATAQTKYSPSLVASSPTQGTEAALAAFDAQYTQQLFWNNVDQPNNIDFTNPFVSVFSNRATIATNGTFNNEISKATATGARFALRHVVNYSRSNQNNQAFNSSFVGWVEAEWRQPLLQGSGVLYNQIVGPVSAQNIYQTPGQYNGVLIARINEDVALADFESGVVSLVSDVEEAYWGLSQAYRVLDATVKGRQAAQQTFQYQEVRLDVGAGRSDEEAQARSQFYQFQAQVESALGSDTGLYALEQRLRYLIGLPATDGRLIKPTTQPSDVRVVFDWQSALGQAVERRVEVRRQRFNVKRRELELTAARLNYRPRLDFLAQYRWRGLGDHLIGDSNSGQFDNLYGSITGGDYQEGQAGIEMSLPVGFRLAGVAIASAKLNIKRERAILAETELRISHDLSDAARGIALTYQLVETNFNRYQADLKQVEVLRRRYIDGNDNINFLLQAQRQVVTSETAFYTSLFDYNLAIRDFHQEKGSLLAYNQVQLAEGPWAAKAYSDAHRMGRFLEPRENPGSIDMTRPISSGPFDPAQAQATTYIASEPATFDMIDDQVSPENSSDSGDDEDQMDDRSDSDLQDEIDGEVEGAGEDLAGLLSSGLRN